MLGTGARGCALAKAGFVLIDSDSYGRGMAECAGRARDHQRDLGCGRLGFWTV